MDSQPEVSPVPPPPRNTRKTWIIIGSILAALAACICIAALITAAVLGIKYLSDDGRPARSRAVGTWPLTYDWACTGSEQTGVFYLYEDGTFADDTEATGTWVLSGDQITMAYEGGTVYTGTLGEGEMSGTMVAFDGATGCWNASRSGP